MILRSACNSCHETFEIFIQPDDGRLVQQLIDQDGLISCPRLCGGKINAGYDRQLDALIDAMRPCRALTAKELYKAVHGAGMPDEIPKSPELVDALLKSSEIVETELEQVGDCIYLHVLKLKNGSTIHLAAGGRGAQVLKVTR